MAKRETPGNIMTHLDHLQLRLSSEKARMTMATTARQVTFYQSVVTGIQKEIAGEYKFLGIAPPAPCELDEDQLLAELLA